VSTAAGEPRQLTREDRAILAVECDTVAGHTCKVVVCDAPAPSLDELRTRIGAGLAAAPALRWKLGGTEDRPAWIDCEEFDIADHVTGDPRGGLLARADLPRAVADRFQRRLDRSRPLWAIDYLPLDGEGFALVWRIHHALADGSTAMRFAREVLWDPDEGAPPGLPAAHHSAPETTDRRRHHVISFIDHELGESLHRSPFDGSITPERRVAFASVEMEPLHAAAKQLDSATLNDAVLAVTSGAMRHWIEAQHGSLRGVRAQVPVSLHRDGEDLGNRDSFFTVCLPLAESDPVARLRHVHAQTERRKHDRDAETNDALLRELNAHSPRLERLCKRIESSPRRFAVSISNVHGPRRPVTVLGSRVESLHSLAEIGRRHALRVAVVSVAGRLDFGFCSDPHLVPDLDRMAAGVEAEAELLVKAAA
jgi:hypothetical protein